MGRPRQRLDASSAPGFRDPHGVSCTTCSKSGLHEPGCTTEPQVVREAWLRDQVGPDPLAESPAEWPELPTTRPKDDPVLAWRVWGLTARGDLCSPFWMQSVGSENL